MVKKETFTMLMKGGVNKYVVGVFVGNVLNI